MRTWSAEARRLLYPGRVEGIRQSTSTAHKGHGRWVPARSCFDALGELEETFIGVEAALWWNGSYSWRTLLGFTMTIPPARGGTHLAGFPRRAETRVRSKRYARLRIASAGRKDFARAGDMTAARGLTAVLR